MSSPCFPYNVSLPLSNSFYTTCLILPSVWGGVRLWVLCPSVRGCFLLVLFPCATTFYILPRFCCFVSLHGIHVSPFSYVLVGKDCATCTLSWYVVITMRPWWCVHAVAQGGVQPRKIVPFLLPLVSEWLSNTPPRAYWGHWSICFIDQYLHPNSRPLRI